MSMSPISYKGFSFQIASLAALSAVLTADALYDAFGPQWRSYGEAGQGPKPPYDTSAGPVAGPVQPGAQTWANVIAASGPAASSQIPREQIRDVLTLALTTTNTPNAFDVADHLLQVQLSRSAELMCSQLVLACIAAGS